MSNLPTLDYDYNSLEPHIDAKTMEIHHSKHHQAYISKFDAAVEGSSLEHQRLFEILSDFSTVPDDKKVPYEIMGVGINHSLFWKVIGPNCGGNPTGDLASAINDAFGSFDEFKEALQMRQQHVSAVVGYGLLLMLEANSVSHLHPIKIHL